MEQQAILGSLAGAHDALLKGELSVSAGGGFSAPRPEARGGGLLPAVSATPPSPQSGRATGFTSGRAQTWNVGLRNPVRPCSGERPRNAH